MVLHSLFDAAVRRLDNDPNPALTSLVDFDFDIVISSQPLSQRAKFIQLSYRCNCYVISVVILVSMQIINWKCLNAVHRFDVQTLLAVNQSRHHHTWSKSARWLSRSADGWWYLLLPPLIYALSPPDSGAFLVSLLQAFLLERLLYLVAKNSFRRSRPPQVIRGFHSVIKASDEFSFPSGHTSGAFLVATILCYWLGAHYLWLYPWACLVGASRVVLGVHFPTDILAGAAMGSLIGLSISATVAV